MVDHRILSERPARPRTGDREAAGFTARIDLAGLPRAQRIFYRVQFEDLSDSRNLSVPAAGSFLSAPARPRDVTMAWSADTVGQGWGINKEFGGMRMYETIRRAGPDVFIHTAATPSTPTRRCPPEIRLPDGNAVEERHHAREIKGC